MHHILVYADSLSWGIIPNTRQRLVFDRRWPGVMENYLHRNNVSVRVIEDCLNGRRTTLEDPFKPGRDGRDGLQEAVEMGSPLALVILMLGTNDFQSMHNHTTWHSAQGMGALIAAVRQAPIEPGMPVPPILLIAPPPIQSPKGPIAPKFVGGDEKSRGLAAAYEQLARESDCHFLDAGTITSSSEVDGIHLDEPQHLALGKAVAEKVAEIIK